MPQLPIRPIHIFNKTAHAVDTALFTAIKPQLGYRSWYRVFLVLSAASAVNVVVSDGTTTKKYPALGGLPFVAMEFDFAAPKEEQSDPAKELDYTIEHTGTGGPLDIVSLTVEEFVREA